MGRKGFFFTVMALIIISFIFISVQLWAQTTQAQEQRYADKFKTYAMQNAISVASEGSFSKFVSASMVYSVNKFATSLEENPTPNIRGVYNTKNKKSNDPNNYVNDKEGTFYLNKSIYELMIYGNTSGYLTDASNSYPPAKNFYNFHQILSPENGGIKINSSNLTYSSDEMRYTLDNYFKTTKKAAQIIGYNISWGKPRKFTFNQSDAWTIYVSFEVPLNFSSADGTLQSSRNLSVNSSFDIHGLTDPYIAREHIEYIKGVQLQILEPFKVYDLPHRNIYHVPSYQDRDDAAAKQVDTTILEGMGWFFGPVASYQDVNRFSKDNYKFNSSKIGSYILMAPASAYKDVIKKYSGSFGGIILYGSRGLSTETTLHQINPTCHYRQVNQTNCLYCISSYEIIRGASPGCDGVDFERDYPNLLKSYYIWDTVPINRNISYSHVLGAAPIRNVPSNYHLDLSEVLITNSKNFSDICPRGSDCTKPNNFNLEQKGGATEDHSIWDLTGPRDMAICGFYVESPFGPSYMQRFLSLKQYGDGAMRPPYSTYGYGIESFNVGAWAGGWDDPNSNSGSSSKYDPEVRSRIDYHFYSSYNNLKPYCAAPFYSGMPGCKSIDMCNNSTLSQTVGVGRFAMTDKEDSPAADYNIDSLIFDDAYNWGDVIVCK